MHKRLLTVALGLSLGLVATAASSRTYDFDRNTWSAERGDGSEHAQDSRQRHRVAYAYRADGDDVDEPVRRRSITRDRDSTRGARRGGGGASASRGCLKPAARALLDKIEAKFGRMQIISTCRPGATIAGTGHRSKHATGEAIDFNAGGRKAEVVRWLIANHKAGGTMTYRDMSHIHVDVGYHFVALGSASGR